MLSTSKKILCFCFDERKIQYAILLIFYNVVAPTSSKTLNIFGSLHITLYDVCNQPDEIVYNITPSNFTIP